MSDRVLSIDEALKEFKQEEKIIIETPVFIKQKELYNIDLEDDFFITLKRDYLGFDRWFEKKQREGRKVYSFK